MKSSLVSLVFFSFFLAYARIENHQCIMRQQEIIAHHTFEHVCQIHNGVKQEKWLIDHELCTLDTYEKEMAQALYEETRQERLLNQERFEKQCESMIAVQKSCLQKIIKLSAQKIERLLKKLQDSRLRDYYAFDKATISNQEVFDYIAHTLLPKVKNAFSASADISITELQQVSGELEVYPDRLINFYYATVNKAQENADDTRLLKELLVLASESWQC